MRYDIHFEYSQQHWTEENGKRSCVFHCSKLYFLKRWIGAHDSLSCTITSEAYIRGPASSTDVVIHTSSLALNAHIIYVRLSSLNFIVITRRKVFARVGTYSMLESLYGRCYWRFRCFHQLWTARRMPWIKLTASCIIHGPWSCISHASLQPSKSVNCRCCSSTVPEHNSHVVELMKRLAL